MSLTVEEKKLVSATVPLLESGGPQLTTHFYKRMMSHNPEVRKFFNQTHQKDGIQAKALANSVLFYAKNIDHLENLGQIAAVIVHKHVGLNIKPEHYPIVGTNLLSAMREVLGPDVATDAVIAAWHKAYNQLAQIFISAEKQLYEQIETTEGGWSGFRKFQIAERIKETSDIVSIILRPSDGKKVIPAVPGQFLTIKAEIEGTKCRRTYTVSNKVNDREYRITVKNVGMFSGWLHNLKLGEEIDVRPPVGEFTIAEQPKEELVLIAGGVGITPIAAFALAGYKAKMLYYARTPEDLALLPELQREPNLSIVPVGAIPTAEEIKAHAGPNSIVYTTGPTGFMKCIHSLLGEAGVPEEKRKFEWFTSVQNFKDIN